MGERMKERSVCEGGARKEVRLLCVSVSVSVSERWKRGKGRE